jgi:hypothetical protein
MWHHKSFGKHEEATDQLAQMIARPVISIMRRVSAAMNGRFNGYTLSKQRYLFWSFVLLSGMLVCCSSMLMTSIPKAGLQTGFPTVSIGRPSPAIPRSDHQLTDSLTQKP